MVELEQFGWNALTFSFLATVFFAFWGARELRKQLREIWRTRSGTSVSVTSFLLSGLLFSSGIVYGFHMRQLAPIVQGASRTPFVIFILVGLWRFKGFTRIEKWLGIGLTAFCIATVLVGASELEFLVISLLCIAGAAAQPWEIWHARSAGVVSLNLQVVYLASTSFWTCYGVFIHDRLIWITSAAFTAIYALTIMLWFWYRPEPVIMPGHSRE